MSEKIYRVKLNSKGMPNFATAEEIADRPQEWIPCSERLPNEKEVVLITNDKGNVRCGQFRGTYKKWWNWKGNTLETVLAWMPLPKPWKGADDYERAIEQVEHDMLYEPTYNSEDGSM